MAIIYSCWTLLSKLHIKPTVTGGLFVAGRIRIGGWWRERYSKSDEIDFYERPRECKMECSRRRRLCVNVMR